MRATMTLASSGLLMCAFTALSPWIIRAYDFKVFVPLLVASGFVTIAAVRLAPRVSAPIGVAIVIGLGLVMRVLLMVQDPLLSTDVYRYVWDGRVQGARINPYTYVPADPALAALRDGAVFPNINRADYAVTAYPPIAQMFFWLVTRLSETIVGMRVAMIACEGVIALVMADLLRALRLSPVAVVAWVWHPLAIWEISNNGHVDALMVALLMAGVWLFVRQRDIAGGIAVTMSALVKPYALAVLPAFWRPWNWRLPVAVIVTLLVAYAPYMGAGAGVFGFVNAAGYLAEEGHTSGEGYWLVALARLAFGPVAAFKPVYLAVAVVVLGLLALRIAFRKAPNLEQSLFDIACLLIAGLFLLSPNYSWYFLAVVPFIVLGVGAPGWALTLAAIFLYRPVILPAHDLAWKTIATMPFVVSMALVLLKRRATRRSSAIEPGRAADAVR